MGGVAIGSDGEGEGGDGRMAVVMRREERWAEMVREIEGTWFWEVGERDGTQGAVEYGCEEKERDRRAGLG